MWNVLEEGAPVDKIKATGLEIVRSETPIAVRSRLKEVLTMILRKTPDAELSSKIVQFRKEILASTPYQIAVNIGVSDIEKYCDQSGNATKGTPWHTHGVINFRKLLKLLHLENKYEDITSGGKVKTVYVKKNPHNMETISFIHWPDEFDNIIQIDYNRMVEKYFIEKIRTLLGPMNKVGLLNNDATSIGMFW